MQREALSAFLEFSMTRSDKEWLARMAHERGITMSGLLRKLIREAAAESGLIEVTLPPKPKRRARKAAEDHDA